MREQGADIGIREMNLAKIMRLLAHQNVANKLNRE
jgi:hypothetical protein